MIRGSLLSVQSAFLTRGSHNPLKTPFPSWFRHSRAQVGSFICHTPASSGVIWTRKYTEIWYFTGSLSISGVSAKSFNKLASRLAVTLLADCRRAEGSGTGDRNARHMVVIKPGAAERSVYISMLPMGLCSFMEVLCQSPRSLCCALCLQRQNWKLK